MHCYVQILLFRFYNVYFYDENIINFGISAIFRISSNNTGSYKLKTLEELSKLQNCIIKELFNEV